MKESQERNQNEHKKSQKNQKISKNFKQSQKNNLKIAKK